MKVVNIFLIAALLMSYVSACLASGVVKLNNPFSEDEVKWVLEKGSAEVSGSANITLENGVKKGCASFNVELLPVAGYSSERILNIYGNNLGGQILLSQNPPKFDPDEKKYHELLIATTCNAKNKFKFSNVPKGEYYLIAFIIWEEERDGEVKKLGGSAMKKINVKENSNNVVNL